jgi:hypothetical protein
MADNTNRAFRMASGSSSPTWYLVAVNRRLAPKERAGNNVLDHVVGFVVVV